MKRFIFIFTILGIINSYIAYSLLLKADLLGFNYSSAIFISFFILFCLQSSIILFERIIPGAKPQGKIGKKLFSFLTIVSYAVFGLISCLLVYVAIADVIFLIAACVASLIFFDIKIVICCELALIAVATCFSAVIGIINASRFEVKKVEIFLEKLPSSFDGFKIVQISDLHIGGIIKRPYVQKIVRAINDLKADLIALTGDFVDGQVDELQFCVAPLAELKSKYGSFFVTGNHEYYWDAKAWVAEFRRLGINVLVNEHEIIDNGSDQIAIAGVSDYYTLHHLGGPAKRGAANAAFFKINPSDQMSPKKAAQGLSEKITKILLAHQPKSYELAQAAGFDLQLSGHTHGGQYFPFTFLIRFFQPFYKGLNRYKNMVIYVNRGTGYWGPPLRTGGASEITLIILKSLAKK